MNKYIAYISIFIVINLYGCVTKEYGTSVAPTARLSPTLTSTKLPNIITKTPTPFPTLLPEEVTKEVKEFLLTGGKCLAPCLWDVYPAKTSYEEMTHLFSRLGKNGFVTSSGNHTYYTTSFKYKDSIHIDIKVDSENHIVKNMKSSIDGLSKPNITPDEWKGFSLKEILETYGIPSLIDIYLDLPNNFALYGIRLYYGSSNMYVLFNGSGSYNPAVDRASAHICPTGDEITDMVVWVGNDPVDMIPNGIPLKNVTSLDLDKFHSLIVETPEKACFDLQLSAFPWFVGK
jgi:hypothetical protein